METTANKLAEDQKQLMTEMGRIDFELGRLNEEEQDFLKSEKAIFRTKFEALQLFDKVESDLADYIAKFNRSEGDGAPGYGWLSSASSVGSPGKVAHLMGTAPPCHLYMDLQVFGEISKLALKCLTAETSDDLIGFKKELSTACAPWRDLFSVCKIAKNDACKRRATWR